jgi:hypothetical protein
MAPEWIIVPSLLVLGYTVLAFKANTPGAFAAGLRGVCAIASFFALGAVAWWVGRMFGLQR